MNKLSSLRKEFNKLEKGYFPKRAKLERGLVGELLNMIEETPKDSKSIQETAEEITSFIFFETTEKLSEAIGLISELEVPTLPEKQMIAQWKKAGGILLKIKNTPYLNTKKKFEKWARGEK